MDKTIWQKGKEYFIRNNLVNDLVPVLDQKFRLICYAYQDNEANREIRMLKELKRMKGVIGFKDLHPECERVIIHGCNELAYYMAEFLRDEGIAVNVDGKFWNVFEEDKSLDEIPEYENFEIWAEGVHQKRFDLERLRSVSVEFECVDEIYEANIKAGKITNTLGDVNTLLEMLRKERQIVIRGIGTKAQDVYDWLMANGIDICAFQSGKEYMRKSLFGKPIVKKEEVKESFREAVIMECSEKYSAWGFGDVDQYDYEGYERNRRYLLVRDYIEVPQNNIAHLLSGKNLFFVGDKCLCIRVYERLQQFIGNINDMQYWDILDECGNNIKNESIFGTNNSRITKDSVCLLVGTKYSHKYEVTEETMGKYNQYLHKLNDNNICDYTDYFSDITKYTHLEKNDRICKKNLRVYGILLGEIPAYCGNTLVRESLEGHPSIIMIEEYGYFNNNLYSICIRLAEERVCDIVDSFRTMYQKEAAYSDKDMPVGFDKNKFYQKMKILLGNGEKFTSQELFIIFHLSYEAGFGKEYPDLGNVIIYWEPHMWNRQYIKEWGYWLSSTGMKCFILKMVRNRYIYAGSRIHRQRNLARITKLMIAYGPIYIWQKKQKSLFDEYLVRFEDLKCKPQETLLGLCKWIGIVFDKVLLDTTYHGEKSFYDEKITGFDVEPAIKLYEEYFSVFDRMRICLIQGPYQRIYNYPYVGCLNFSRRELQEMFLKDFKWEENCDIGSRKSENDAQSVHERAANLLWKVRFAEIVEIWKDANLEMVEVI
ncbi:MAG: hypothetical protein HFH75_02195 [Lachnospiraceae bacterium]|nr:hypothetical protein [Lachnospiraceae bacterium]